MVMKSFVAGLGCIAAVQVWTWSLKVLMSGKWPAENHLGEAFSKHSLRGRLSGQPLISGEDFAGVRSKVDAHRSEGLLHMRGAGHLQVAVAQTGDWKAHKEVFALKQDWSTQSCCHLCFQLN